MQSLKSNKVIICFFICLAISCAHKVQRLQPSADCNDSLLTPYFQKNDSVYLFNTSVTTYGKNIGGFLILKTTSVDTLKVTFFSQVGFKFFDMEIYRDSFKVKESIHQLHIKGVMNTLEQDIRQMVFWDKVKLEKPQCFHDGKSKGKVLKYDFGGDYLYLYQDSNLIVSSQRTKGRKRKLKNEIKYYNFNNGHAEHISIKHFNFDLLIELQQLK